MATVLANSYAWARANPPEVTLRLADTLEPPSISEFAELQELGPATSKAAYRCGLERFRLHGSGQSHIPDSTVVSVAPDHIKPLNCLSNVAEKKRVALQFALSDR